MNKIPKIIHQTAKNLNSPEILKNVENLKCNNKNWEHYFYDDNDVEKTIQHYYNKDMLKLYQSINPMYSAARIDFFRYLLMFQTGGVYLDIKSGVNKSLDDITKNKDYILTHWDNDIKDGKYPGWGMFFTNVPEGEFQQWHIICKPHHVFLKRVIQAVIFNIQNYSIEKHGVGHMGVLKTTGPIVYTLSILSLINNVKDYQIFRKDSDIGLVYQNIKTNHVHVLYENEKCHYTQLKEPIII